MIGGSIGLALKTHGWRVAGWDPDPGILEEAGSIGAIDRQLSSPDGVDGPADITFLCGPLDATLAALQNLQSERIVTDVASVKGPIVAAGKHLSGFVAGHPMAGSAVSGPRFASAHLFHGASWAICNDNPNDAAIAEVSRVVATMGANPVILTSAEHDAYVATVSHLPRVLASALIDLVSRSPGATRLSAGSFRDLTRVAGSGSKWWSEVLVTNRDPVRSAIGGLVDILKEWDADLAATDGNAIAERLSAAEAGRSRLGAPVAEVRVVLFDRPGEVGRVGIALSDSGVDLRDIQLRHAEYGGGGILTLSITAGENDALRSALARQGFELES
ncbi:MAG TPA: prephenate dehydrogenase/arogenate dehydrogenase family protein [Acidimicrobiia bacterium]